MTKPTIYILVLLFAVAVGKWELLLIAAVVLAVDWWQQSKVEERARAAKEKAEYRDYRDGYDLSWTQVEALIGATKLGMTPSEETKILSGVEMAARYWSRTIGLANCRGYSDGYADAYRVTDPRTANRSQMLKAAWEEYQS